MGRAPKHAARSKGQKCEYCNKRCYSSKKYAKVAARTQYPGEHLTPYQCVAAPEHADTSRLWHLGHLAESVIRGGVPRTVAHRGETVSRGVPDRWSGFPDALRVTMSPSPAPAGDDDQEGGAMPTIGEAAVVTLKGFDRNRGLYRGIGAHSPTHEKAILVHAAARAHAIAHNFDTAKSADNRHPGRAGHLSMTSLIRELFMEDGLTGDRFDQLVKAVTGSAKKAGLIECLDGGDPGIGRLPTWWVADSYESVTGAKLPEEPKAKPAPPRPRPAPPKAAPAKPEPEPEPEPVPEPKAKKGHSLGGRKKGSRNRSRLEVMSLAERTIRELGRPVVLDEIYGSADYPVTKHSLRDSLNELVKERRIVRRQLTPEDREALKEAGGPRNFGPNTWVWMHHSLAPVVDGERQIPIATWGMKSGGEKREEMLGKIAAGVAGARDAGAAVSAMMKQTDKDDDQDDLDARIAAAEAAARAKPKQADASELEELKARVAELEARLAKVTKQRDRLLAVVETMKDE